MIVNFAFESSKTDAYDWIGLYSSTEKKKIAITSPTIMLANLAKTMDL